jgi:formylmethanofuran dehydrogenase subunit E
MDYPAFFDQAPAITVHDGLAELLGACSDGLITYRYIDAVRLAGHSCPTVAAAYLMARRALQILYPDQTPERGMLKVSLAAAQEEGVTGVTASVIGLITGAAGVGGFKGIGGNFRRQDLLRFGEAGAGELRVVRGDNGASVTLQARLARVPPDPRTGALLQAILAGQAAPEQAAQFASLWQERVRKILVEHADDPELIVSSIQ